MSLIASVVEDWIWWIGSQMILLAMERKIIQGQLTYQSKSKSQSVSYFCWSNQKKMLLFIFLSKSQFYVWQSDTTGAYPVRMSSEQIKTALDIKALIRQYVKKCSLFTTNAQKVRSTKSITVFFHREWPVIHSRVFFKKNRKENCLPLSFNRMNLSYIHCQSIRHLPTWISITLYPLSHSQTKYNDCFHLSKQCKETTDRDIR